MITHTLCRGCGKPTSRHRHSGTSARVNAMIAERVARGDSVENLPDEPLMVGEIDWCESSLDHDGRCA